MFKKNIGKIEKLLEVWGNTMGIVWDPVRQNRNIGM